VTGSSFVTLALVYQLGGLESGSLDDLGGLAKLAILFLSPYGALVLLAVALGRERAETVIVLAGAALVTLWGIYWHLDILVFRPDVVGQILSPLLIVGTQWIAVAATAALGLAAKLVRKGLRHLARPPAPRGREADSND
jgi:hypothetical protein